MSKSHPNHITLPDRLRQAADHSWPYAMAVSNLNKPESDNNFGKAATIMREAAEAIENSNIETQKFVPRCSVMIGDYSRGYMVPRGYCMNEIAYQHQDGKTYCEEHKHCAKELDFEWAKMQNQNHVDRKKLQTLVYQWKITRLPKLPDGSLHPMDLVQQKCAKQLEEALKNT